jgi:hypothetical protein
MAFTNAERGSSALPARKLEMLLSILSPSRVLPST